jgi:hypothetical protein
MSLKYFVKKINKSFNKPQSPRHSFRFVVHSASDSGPAKHASSQVAENSPQANNLQ